MSESAVVQKSTVTSPSDKLLNDKVSTLKSSGRTEDVNGEISGTLCCPIPW